MGKLIITDEEVKDRYKPGESMLYILLKLIEAGAPIKITVPRQGVINWEIVGRIGRIKSSTPMEAVTVFEWSDK